MSNSALSVNDDQTGHRIGLVDDDTVRREGLRVLLLRWPTTQAVLPAGRAEAMASGIFDCVDVLLVSARDLGAVGGLLPKGHRARLVLVLDCLDAAILREAVAVPGAAVVTVQDLLADSGPELLEGLLARRVVASDTVTRALFLVAAHSSPRLRTRYGLSARELQALKLVAAGATNREVARSMGISEHGVKRHLSQVFAKLGTTNRTMAASVALNEGLLDPTQDSRSSA